MASVNSRFQMSTKSTLLGFLLQMLRSRVAEITSCVYVYEIARFLGVFGINTASDISKLTDISRAAAAASDIWGVLKYHESVFIPNTPKKPCYFLFILQGEEISHFT